MPAALVQKATNSGSTGPGTCTITGVTPGNYLTVQITARDAAAIGTPTDSGGTWTDILNYGVSQNAIYVGKQPGAAGGTHTANATLSTAGWSIVICEWSGMDPTTAVDIAQPAVTATFTNTISVPAQTLAQADELVLGTLGVLDGGSVNNPVTTPTGFTSLYSQTNGTPANGYNIGGFSYIASNGSTSLPATTWNLTNHNGTILGACIVTFKTVAPRPKQPFAQVCS